LTAFEQAPSELSAKWASVLSRILAEKETLAACRSDEGNCPAAARRLLTIIELGRKREGFARLGEINRAANLSIKPVSDWTRFGVQDYWSTPIATMRIGTGDCEDYAILKYFALLEAGIPQNDLRLLIVGDIKRKTSHALVAVRLGEQWLLLDNRMLVMLDATQARNYYPLFVLDHRGVRGFAPAVIAR
jgi:predicted transglutaminase-like cysteine proteinase